MRRRGVDGERDFNKDTMRGSSVRCPQQSNFSDCGIYVLQYAESFFTVHAQICLNVFFSNFRMLLHKVITAGQSGKSCLLSMLAYHPSDLF